MRARREWRAPAAAVAAVWILALFAGVGGIAAHDRTRGDGFSVVRWELTTLPNRWLHLAGAPLRDDPPADAAIAAYFAPAEPLPPAQQRRLENVVERAIEGRLDAVARAAGLARDPWGPLPGRLLGPLALLPPVDVEFAGAPRVLVRSPREVIRRLDTRLLDPALPAARAQALEVAAERDAGVSARVVGTGGVATYPAILAPRASYRATVELAAHEWLHHYLAPYPLGRAYFRGAEGQTINETVVDLAAVDLARAVIDRFGDPTAPAVSAAAVPAPAVDRDAVLRALRGEVDGLLATGEVARAEERMAETAALLDRAGLGVGRINQAFFAWYGIYAARADAIDPLGAQLRMLRARSPDVGAFLRRARDLDSRAAVERALAASDGAASDGAATDGPAG